jgi:AcrR family transcriptional regulator
MNASKKRFVSRAEPPVPPAGKQDRAIVTRRRLTDAARRIFARDGFENARVEDIAAAAGKTRGAFYANFRDKEDVFFAIFEEYLSHDREQVKFRLRATSSHAERIDALARHLATIIRDRRRMLLALEFKQYAIRHPRKHKRLAGLHAALCARCMETDLDKLLPEFANASADAKRSQSSQIGAILEGLALNLMFDEGSLSEEQVIRQIRVNLDLVLAAERGDAGCC